jgi:hypothetical protein
VIVKKVGGEKIVVMIKIQLLVLVIHTTTHTHVLVTESVRKIIGVDVRDHGLDQIVHKREGLHLATAIVSQKIGVFATKIQNSEDGHMEDRTDTKEDVGKKKVDVNITRIVIDHVMDTEIATDMEIVMGMVDVMDTDNAIIMLIGWV